MTIGATTGSGAGFLVVVAFLAIAVLVRQGRRQSRGADLQRGERIRPLAITCIDPLISLIIIGPLLWRLISESGGNLAGAIAGAVAGVVIGYFRARVMFVRAQKHSFSVVLKRSGIEYGLVLVLIVLRSIEGRLTLDHTSAATIAVAALAGLGLVEAFARAGFIIARYVTHVPVSDVPAAPGGVDGQEPGVIEGGAQPPDA